MNENYINDLKSQIENLKLKSDKNPDLENEIMKLKLIVDNNKENINNLNEEKTKNELINY